MIRTYSLIKENKILFGKSIRGGTVGVVFRKKKSSEKERWGQKVKKIGEGRGTYIHWTKDKRTT